MVSDFRRDDKSTSMYPLVLSFHSPSLFPNPSIDNTDKAEDESPSNRYSGSGKEEEAQVLLPVKNNKKENSSQKSSEGDHGH